MTEQQLIDSYLDWVNNYISLEAFSGAYGVHRDVGLQMIRLGRKYHEKRLQEAGR